jgi:lipopolysaccharide/colanic/teichoic acid biosynthesis glycosyltransferase
MFREEKASFVGGKKSHKIMSAESYFSDRGRPGDSAPLGISPQFLPILEEIGNAGAGEPGIHFDSPNFISLGQATTQNSSNARVPLWKRSLDVTLILLTLPIWLVVMLVLAAWIKIVSPGPVFFRQDRVGFRGNRFMILKFRTMKVNVETQTHERHLEQLIQQNAPMTKLDAAGDPRIIRGGRLIRATGLDELPQILNVLLGEMSLVGPRPCTVKEFDRYLPWHKERVNAAPGLTGYWQVNGKNKTTFAEMIEMDILYSKEMSIWLDLRIMLKTPVAIAKQLLETRARRNLSKDFGKPCLR